MPHPQGAEGDPLEELRNTWAFQRYLSALQERAVRSARADGHSWEEIAGAVGTSRQAAWQRWGAACERRDRSDTSSEREQAR
jgi:hypothetical protein